MILLFTSCLIGLQLYGIRQMGVARGLLTSGEFKVGDEVVPAAEILSYSRIYLMFLFGLNLIVWLLGFIHVHPLAGALGCGFAFCDFVLNNEVISRLVEKPFSEKGATRILFVGLLLAILQVSCCLWLLGLVIMKEMS